MGESVNKILGYTKLINFVEENDCGIVVTNEKGEFKIYNHDEAVEEIILKTAKIDYIGVENFIVVLIDGTSVKVEAL